ncbi:MAG: peptide chain release factor 2 [Bacillota bacterium]|nr:peptide chain release factor 2 [Bacillota bacterium]NLL27140.1 peptide chain release factor 2 [Erysipelotrichia bacterium]
MELYEIRQQLTNVSTNIEALKESLDQETKQKRIDEIDKLMLDENFWSDRKKAQSLIDEVNSLKDMLESMETLSSAIKEIDELLNSLKDDEDEEMQFLVQQEFEEIIKKYQQFEITVLLSEPYDRHNAIIELHPGAGGTESQDWAQMLYRMYTRYCDLKGFKVTVLDYLDGDEAGLKSCSMLIEGPLAYGYLKGEKGVHRLVRISPFDSGGRRHTSFASVDVMPEFDDDIVIDIKPEDLEIDTHRASGAGGQHVNKTDSAVRVTHKPTGIVTTCQSERSQLQNRERAINMLKSKLYQRYIEEQQSKLAAIKGEQKLIEWGSQIRSYIFCPYTLVKDHRTDYEETNVERVMDGQIDNFIYSYLKSQID